MGQTIKIGQPEGERKDFHEDLVLQFILLIVRFLISKYMCDPKDTFIQKKNKLSTF